MTTPLRTAAPCVGRPRDAAADDRILRAALTLYGEAGWSGFNMTQIARIANVGKSSLYARWDEREALLLCAFQALIPVPKPVGTTVWEILNNWARLRVHMYLGPKSKAVRRVFVEMSTGEPVIQSIYDYLYQEPIKALQTRLWEFKNDSYLPTEVSVTRLVDSIEGSVLMRGFCIPAENLECFLTEIPEYVEALVSDQLRSTVQSPALRLVRLSS